MHNPKAITPTPPKTMIKPSIEQFIAAKVGIIWKDTKFKEDNVQKHKWKICLFDTKFLSL